jgi:hypothetical protein
MALFTPADREKYVRQPYFATVEVRLSGTSGELLDKIAPQHLVSFSFTNTSDAVGSARLQVYDKEYTRVLNLLHELGDKDISFRFGYTNGLWSPWHTGNVDNIQPEFRQTGAMLDIEIKSLMYTLNEEKKTRTWEGVPFPHSLATEIADENGYQADVVSTKPITENSRDKGKTKELKKVYYQNNESDMQFLKRVAKDCRTAKDGRAGYEVWVEESSNASKPILHFGPKPIDKESEEFLRDFYINFHEKSEVISYAPQFSFKPMARFGADDNFGTSFDNITKRVDQTTINTSKESTGGKVLLAKKGKLYSDERQRTHNITAHKLDQLNQFIKKEFYRHLYSSLTATLTIIGDPLIKVHQTCRVFHQTQGFYSRDGDNYKLKHLLLHTSAKFVVDEITHNIDSGGYTTELSLNSDGVLVGDDELAGKGSNLEDISKTGQLNVGGKKE